MTLKKFKNILSVRLIQDSIILQQHKNLLEHLDERSGKKIWIRSWQSLSMAGWRWQ